MQAKLLGCFSVLFLFLLNAEAPQLARTEWWQSLISTCMHATDYFL